MDGADLVNLGWVGEPIRQTREQGSSLALFFWGDKSSGRMGPSLISGPAPPCLGMLSRTALTAACCRDEEVVP